MSQRKLKSVQFPWFISNNMLLTVFWTQPSLLSWYFPSLLGNHFSKVRVKKQVLTRQTIYRTCFIYYYLSKSVTFLRGSTCLKTRVTGQAPVVKINIYYDLCLWLLHSGQHKRVPQHYIQTAVFYKHIQKSLIETMPQIWSAILNFMFILKQFQPFPGTLANSYRIGQIIIILKW